MAGFIGGFIKAARESIDDAAEAAAKNIDAVPARGTDALRDAVDAARPGNTLPDTVPYRAPDAPVNELPSGSDVYNVDSTGAVRNPADPRDIGPANNVDYKLIEDAEVILDDAPASSVNAQQAASEVPPRSSAVGSDDVEAVVSQAVETPEVILARAQAVKFEKEGDAALMAAQTGARRADIDIAKAAEEAAAKTMTGRFKSAAVMGATGLVVATGAVLGIGGTAEVASKLVSEEGSGIVSTTIKAYTTSASRNLDVQERSRLDAQMRGREADIINAQIMGGPSLTRQEIMDVASADVRLIRGQNVGDLVAAVSSQIGLPGSFDANERNIISGAFGHALNNTIPDAGIKPEEFDAFRRDFAADLDEGLSALPDAEKEAAISILATGQSGNLLNKAYNLEIQN